MEYLSIYFPHWSLDLVKRKLLIEKPGAIHQPILLASKIANQLTVTKACKTALKIGVRPGMSLPLAQALAPNAYIAPFNSIQNIRALYKIAVWAINISPLVSIKFAKLNKLQQSTADDGLLIDISGTERLYGNRDKLLQKLLRKFELVGLETSMAIAPTIGAAWALARFSGKKTSIVAWADIKPILAKMPTRALRIPAEAIDALRDIGVVNIEQLTKLPRKKLPIRYGIEVLRRIDQAIGAVDEPFRAIKVRRKSQCRRAFEIPLTSHESVRRIVMLLFKELIAQLESYSLQAASFIIEFKIIGTDRGILTKTKELSLYSATKDFAYLSSIIGPIIETIHAPGGIRSISVAASKTEPFNSQQSDFLNLANQNLDRAINSLFDNFSARLGPQRVYQVKFENSYIPEKSFSYHPRLKKSESKRAQPVAIVKADRPSYLFDKPEPIRAIAMLPDKPPSLLTWHGKQYKIKTGIGPERISGEWWSDAQETRDYFKVQDSDGRWIWVFRKLNSLEWYVHGLWL